MLDVVRRTDTIGRDSMYANGLCERCMSHGCDYNAIAKPAAATANPKATSFPFVAALVKALGTAFAVLLLVATALEDVEVAAVVVSSKWKGSSLVDIDLLMGAVSVLVCYATLGLALVLKIVS